MDQIAIVEQAVRNTMRHRALWVLGFLWALVGGCGGGVYGPTFQVDGDWVSDYADAPHLFGEPVSVGSIVGLILLSCLALTALIVVTTVAKYVLHAGIFRSLYQLHTEGAAPSVRSAWREGWHRRTWRLFFQNLVVDVPFVFLIFAGLVAAVVPVLVVTGVMAGKELLPLGIVAMLGMLFAYVLVIIAVGTVLTVLKQFWWREAVIGDYQFLTAIREGWNLVRANVGDIAVMWLVMLGANIIWGAVVFMVLLLAGLLTLGVVVLPGVAIFQASGLWLALGYGIPAGFITFFVPITFAGGLYLVFSADVWNQVYEQLAMDRDLSA
jgi:hypothetical protein